MDRYQFWGIFAMLGLIAYYLDRIARLADRIAERYDEAEIEADDEPDE